MGLPKLRDVDQLKVDVGNALFKFSCSVLRLCSRLVIPAALENPAASRLWICPPMKHILSLKTASIYRADFCMFNRPWRKRTQFISVHVDLSAAERKCLGR
eukprot:6139137-Pyramimonas_sp.AAC.1